MVLTRIHPHSSSSRIKPATMKLLTYAISMSVAKTHIVKNHVPTSSKYKTLLSVDCNKINLTFLTLKKETLKNNLNSSFQKFNS